MTSRRSFISTASLAAIGVALNPTKRQARSSFVDIHRPPDFVTAQFADTEVALTRTGDRWTGNGALVDTVPSPIGVSVALSSGNPIKRIHLRWRGDQSAIRLFLGDAWERGYGDLEWRAEVPDRVMPWYCAAWDGTLTHGYGVRTSPKAFCFWRADAEGLSLWCDVRSGGVPVVLGDRTLTVCDVIARRGRPQESAFAALHALCRAMCPAPRLPAQPIYGHNDWYYAYGNNSPTTVMTDVHNIVELSPAGPNRPFAVIDDGWEPGHGNWQHGNQKFGDMAQLAARMKAAGVRPGVWYRPLEGPGDPLDPTAPGIREQISEDIRRFKQWGFELIKHDYSTYDVLGRWGASMGSALTRDNKSFAEGNHRTTAEIIDDLYQVLRTAAGDTPLIGCNTVSHLSAGRFEICRVGDDTSGSEWDRTRKMGVNTLAFRGVQHGAFYVADPDCVGVTKDIPWSLNRQWLDLLAKSGTMLFVSLQPAALDDEKRRDLRAALALAATPRPLGEPLDWMRSVVPEHWKLMGRDVRYDWMETGKGVSEA